VAVLAVALKKIQAMEILAEQELQDKVMQVVHLHLREAHFQQVVVVALAQLEAQHNQIL
jgi:hypothetical protein